MNNIAVIPNFLFLCKQKRAQEFLTSETSRSTKPCQIDVPARPLQLYTVVNATGCTLRAKQLCQRKNGVWVAYS